jgi:hypothetical protein
LFKKPGGVATAGGVWETQFAASLRVFSFQCSVFSQSQRQSATGWDLALLIAGGRADVRASWSIFGELLALLKVSAHRDPTRLNTCFEIGRRCNRVADTEG